LANGVLKDGALESGAGDELLFLRGVDLVAFNLLDVNGGQVGKGLLGEVALAAQGDNGIRKAHGMYVRLWNECGVASG
jgi:hypothetical protein